MSGKLVGDKTQTHRHTKKISTRKWGMLSVKGALWTLVVRMQ